MASLATSGRARRDLCCWRDCGGWSTAATIAPASPSSTAAASLRSSSPSASWRASPPAWKGAFPKAPSASATRAGRRTAAPATLTLTPTAIATATSSSSTTASSRTTSPSDSDCARRATASAPTRTPRSYRTSSNRSSRRGCRWSTRCDARSASSTAPTPCSSCRPASRTRSWRRGSATPAASSSATATARCSSPATCPLSCRTRSRMVFLTSGDVAAVTSTGRNLLDRQRQARSSGRRRSYPSTRWPRPRAATSTSCSRRSWSSRRPCSTPSAAASSSTRWGCSSKTCRSAEALKRIQRVVLVAMGTSLHAAMVGKHYIEQIAGLPAEVDNASEFRYRNPIIGPETLRHLRRPVRRDRRHAGGDGGGEAEAARWR